MRYLKDFAFSSSDPSEGEEGFKEPLLLRSFSEAFLQLNWFNRGDKWERTLHIYAEDYHHDGSPNILTLQFTEDDGYPGTPIRYRTAAAYDGDNDGYFDSFTNSDLNNDGIASKADKALLRTLANAYLPLQWHDA